MLTLGIDFSLRSTGICLLSNSDIIHYEQLATKRSDASCMYKDCLATVDTMYQNLCSVIQLYGIPDKVIIESLSLNSVGNVTRAIALALGMLLQRLSFTGITNIYMVPAATNKKFATDKGNATKDEMVMSIAKHNPEFHEVLANIAKSKGRYDIADAYWLAHYGVEHCGTN